MCYVSQKGAPKVSSTQCWYSYEHRQFVLISYCHDRKLKLTPRTNPNSKAMTGWMPPWIMLLTQPKKMKCHSGLLCCINFIIPMSLTLPCRKQIIECYQRMCNTLYHNNIHKGTATTLLFYKCQVASCGRGPHLPVAGRKIDPECWVVRLAVAPIPSHTSWTYNSSCSRSRYLAWFCTETSRSNAEHSAIITL